MSLIAHGRLVYPIYGIRVRSPAVAEYVVAVFYGGLHAVGLMLGIATLVLSLAMLRGVYGKRIAYLGFATAVLDIIGAYPDAIGPTLTLMCQVFFAAWFVAVGSKLYRMGQLADLVAALKKAFALSSRAERGIFSNITDGSAGPDTRPRSVAALGMTVLYPRAHSATASRSALVCRGATRIVLACVRQAG